MDNRVMDATGGPSAALVMLAFLQADCRGAEIQKELLSLGHEFHATRDINCNGPRVDPQEDGDLETDGHLEYESVQMDLHDIQPEVELQWQWNHDGAANIQQVAGELRVIADQFEESVMAQATSNLMRNTSDSRSEQWRTHLHSEVERIMRNGTGLEHLPQERVFMALTLTLVKGVCQQAPQLLRSLFNAALQFISPARAR